MDVSRIELRVPTRPENAHYLRTKQGRMGHDVTESRPTPGRSWRHLLAGRMPSGGRARRRYGPLVGAGAPYVVAQLGQSLDGFIAARTGDAMLRDRRGRPDPPAPAARTGRRRRRRRRDRRRRRLPAHRSRRRRAPTRCASSSTRTPVHRATRSCYQRPDGARRSGSSATTADARRARPLTSRSCDCRAPAHDGGFAPSDVLDLLAARGLGRVLGRRRRGHRVAVPRRRALSIGSW